MTCVVTGAAHGLGRALALRLKDDGESLLAIDRDAGALDALGVPYLAIDLLEPCAADRIATAAPITRIIHSAGISATGAFESIPAAHHACVIDLNFTVPMALTCRLLELGAFAPDAQHVFIGSVSTYTGYPGAVSYAASKDGLASFAASLSKALPKGQSASCVFPGPMATDHAARYAPSNDAKTVAARQDPAEAAEQILRNLARGKRRILPGGKAKAFAFLGRVAPRLTGRMLRRSLYEKLTEPRV